MSRPAKLSATWRSDLERAIKATKRGETITLSALTAMRGVSKGGFVNFRDQVATQVGFPDGVTKNNQLEYPRLKALNALLAYETRNDASIAEQRDKIARLRGLPSAPVASDPALPPSELLKIDQLASNLEARKIRNRELVRREDVTQTAGKIFSLLSRRLGNLGTQVDPNGKLPADVRAKIAESGSALLLRIHAEMKDMLAGDVEPESDRAPAPRKRTGKA